MSIISGTGRLSLTSAITLVGENPYGGPRFDSALALSLSLAPGVGASQADMLYQSELTLASGATLNLNLADGSLREPTGGALAMAELVAVILAGRSLAGVDTTTEVTVGGGSNPVLGTLSFALKPGGVIYYAGKDANGLCPVTTGSADTLRLVNAAGAAAKLQALLIGRSA